jgi:hypothetical protein
MSVSNRQTRARGLTKVKTEVGLVQDKGHHLADKRQHVGLYSARDNLIKGAGRT